MLKIETYTKEGLKNIEEGNFLSNEEFNSIKELSTELQRVLDVKQIYRTKTEAITSVLNDVKRPTNAAKYWQSIREQAGMFENLVSDSIEYKLNEVKIKRKQLLIKKLESELDRSIYDYFSQEEMLLDIEEANIELEQLLFKRKSIEISAKDRVREIKMWEEIKNQYNDGSFDTENVDTNQLVGYAASYIKQLYLAITKAKQSNPSEMNNIYGQAFTMVHEAEKRGLLEEVIKQVPQEMLEVIMPELGYIKDDNND